MAKVLRLPISKLTEIRIQVSRNLPLKFSIVPTIALDELFVSPISVQLVDFKQVDGNTTIQEQLVVMALAMKHGVRNVFELGTFDGKTAANLAANLGPEAQILTIDLPASELGMTKHVIDKKDEAYVKKPLSGDKFRGFANVTQYFGDTAQFDFAPWFGTRDMVFVDASHAYDYVRNDTEIALKLLKRGGLLLYHDYGTWPGVSRALNEYVTSDQRFKGLRHVQGTTLCFMLTE